MGAINESAPKSFEDMVENEAVQETASESTETAEEATSEDEQ